MPPRTLQGSLLFLGFAISVFAVFYFSFEYIPKVSEWTQLAALLLLGLFFAFFGAYLASTTLGQPFFDVPRLSWLRPPVVLFLLALLAGIVAELRFLGIDDLSSPVKILASLLVGVGIIFWVARQRAAPARPPRGRPKKSRPKRLRRA